MCVLASSMDAGDRGYNVIVAEDCVATFAHRNHVAALSVLSRMWAKVWSHEQVLDAMMADADTDAGAQPTAAAEKSDPFGNAARAKL